MRLVKGTELTTGQRAEVLSAYVYRWTRENPHRTRAYQCEKCDIRNPYVNDRSAEGHTHPTIPLQSDAEWLADHAFYVTKSGRLSARHKHCEPAFMAEG